MGSSPREKWDPGELVDFSGSALPSSRSVNPKVQETKER